MRNLICDLYLHYYSFIMSIVWIPNHFIGDINLRAFQSVMENELKRAHEMELYKAEELTTPLA